jgi:hypothetical protein
VFLWGMSEIHTFPFRARAVHTMCRRCVEICAFVWAQMYIFGLVADMIRSLLMLELPCVSFVHECLGRSGGFVSELQRDLGCAGDPPTCLP